MTPVVGIDHIYISVSDLARSQAFYDAVFLGVPRCAGLSAQRV